MNSLSFTAILVIASSLAAPAAAQDDSIRIFSPNSDPNRPIQIQSQSGQESGSPPQQRQTAQASTPSTATHPSSSLDNVPEMSAEDAAAMQRIFEMVEESNTIEEIDRDDPLSGMSPDQRAFFEAMQGVVPMTPDQIRMFKQRYNEMQNAQNKEVEPDAERRSRSIDLTLKPGEEAPVIHLQQGTVSTITLSDRNGNPWPVLSVTSGDTNSFSVQTAGPQGESNILVINSIAEYAMSNMVVTLVDHPVPIILILDSRDSTKVDDRVDVRIEKKGPNSQYEVTDTYELPATQDATMMAFLDGLPPDGAEARETNTRDVEAWVYNDQLYVRTPHEIMSPAYTAKSSNVSGISVFVMAQSPVVLVSQNGRLRNVNIKD